MIDFSLLDRSPRLLLEAALRPAQGDRFQPTGFADIGAAEYTRPSAVDGAPGTRMLLVESAQSVANRLEKTCLDGDGADLAPELKGIPYVATTLTNKAEGIAIRTSSLVEAHRLASPFILNVDHGEKKFKDQLALEMSYTSRGQLEWKRIYATLFKYDPNALIHGAFLSLLGDGRIRVARAVSGFIEAEGIEPVISGGVKNSHVDPTGSIQLAGGGEKGVYSNVPYARVEYVARSIKAYFNLDLALVRGYGLAPEATYLIVALSLLKIRRLLDSHLRLRTACDLQLSAAANASAPAGYDLPAEPALLSTVQALIPKCAAWFANPAVTELTSEVVVMKKEKAKTAAAGGATS